MSFPIEHSVIATVSQKDAWDYWTNVIGPGMAKMANDMAQARDDT